MNAYVTGQSVRLSATFTNPDGSVYDPATVTFTYISPSLSSPVAVVYNQSPFTVTRDGLGSYHLDVLATDPGEWYWRAEGDGNGQAAAEDTFYVTATTV